MSQALSRILINDILRVIPTLSAADLDQLEHAIRAARSIDGGYSAEPDAPSGDLDLLVDCICEVVERASGEIAHPMRRTVRDAIEHKAQVTEFFNRLGLSRSHCRALMMLAVELLYHDMRNMALPTTAVTLARHSHRIPAVLDTHFPGYARGGMLPWVINLRTTVTVRQGKR